SVSTSGQDDGEALAVDEAFLDDRTKAPDVALTESDEVQQVLAYLDDMDEREAAVLRLRYGLGGEDPKTLNEIGQALGLTRERVRQIEKEALGKLRDRLEGGADDDPDGESAPEPSTCLPLRRGSAGRRAGACA